MLRVVLVITLLLSLTIACSTNAAGPPRGAVRTDDSPPASSRPTPPEFGHGTAILDNGRESVLIDVDVADRPEQRAYGLMHRESLPPDYGMMFFFFEDVQTPFYMKNTLVPLSIAFFDASGAIVDILDMEPCRADPCPLYTPDRPYRGALEVARGSFERWNIRVGDSIRVAR